MDTKNILRHHLFIKKKNEHRLCFLKAAFFLFLFFILPLVTCPLLGQAVQKKELLESDYSQWGELIVDNVSPDRNWISYRMKYDQRADTLFVRNTKNLQTYPFPKVPRAIFTEDGHVLCLDMDKNLTFLNLKSNNKQVYSNVTQMEYSSTAHHLVVLGKTNTLQLINLNGTAIKKFENVTKFAMSPDKRSILFTTLQNNKHAAGLLNLMKPENVEWIIKDSPYDFDKLTWHHTNNAVSFFGFMKSNNEESLLYFFNIKEHSRFELNPQVQTDFPKGRFIDNNGNYSLRISADQQKVFFSLSPFKNSIPKPDDTVEIWHSGDKYLYPVEKHQGNFDQKSILAVWHPVKRTLKSITSAELPNVTLTGDDNFAIVSNPKDYEPQMETEGPRDYYLINVETSEKTLIFQKQEFAMAYILPSPSGKYIAYFKDNNWWIYDIRKKTHTNVTKKINVPFFGKVYLLASGNAFGTAGWTGNDKEFIIYDQYDLWLISPDGTSSKRLTHGREKQITFRIAAINELDKYDFVYNGVKSKTIDLDQKIILRAVGKDYKSGYFKLNKNTAEQPIVYKDSFLDKMYFQQDIDLYIYREQRFDLSPRLVYREKKKKPVVIYQSNPQQEKYEWSTAKLIRYSNSKGTELQGTLYYPFNYDKNKKYPMIVHVYEKESARIHFYSNPSLLQSYGFNPTFLCSKGYLVLSIDIVHENGNIGRSALDCTVSAVTEAIKIGCVDKNKIGIIGHSFGGYETNFIITQTNIFAAAVSSGSVANLSSAYLTVERDSGLPFAARFQNNVQWRMGKTLFEDPELYYKNSPVSNAAAIQTPLLLWTGKEDYHVDWRQTVEMYMSMRILGKTCTMLLYPEEKHVLTKPKSQIDLSHRVLQWFDYYLKNKSKPAWIFVTN
jgi:dipeptidyl aminopeptidase/acylaminoacyl peptidase